MEMVKTARQVLLKEFRTLKPIQRRFLTALLDNKLRVEPTADTMGIEAKTHYNWLKASQEYRQGFDYVMELFGLYLEADMGHDALVGQRKPIIYKGVITGYYTEKNTQERVTLLKGLLHKYRETATSINVIGPQGLQIGYSIAPPPLEEAQVIENAKEIPVSDRSIENVSRDTDQDKS